MFKNNLSWEIYNFLADIPFYLILHYCVYHVKVKGTVHPRPVCEDPEGFV